MVETAALAAPLAAKAAPSRSLELSSAPASKAVPGAMAESARTAGGDLADQEEKAVKAAAP